ncbi:hypothetical protein ACHAQA_003498 [Verticillium albo-atrum]
MPSLNLAAATLLLLVSQVNGKLCGTPDRAAAPLAVRAYEARSTNVTLPTIIPIPVHFHSVAADESGLLSEDKLREQFDVLHAAFGRYQFNMTLESISYTVNATWAIDFQNPANGLAMRRALRRGDYNALNMYFQDIDLTIGRCDYPKPGATPGSDIFYLDGCQVHSGALPGGTAFENNTEGAFAVHEAGHWLGLPHTFAGGCAHDEGIADTPAHADPTYNCSPGLVLNTCPNQPGNDPIYNYMNYNYE